MADIALTIPRVARARCATRRLAIATAALVVACGPGFAATRISTGFTPLRQRWTRPDSTTIVFYRFVNPTPDTLQAPFGLTLSDIRPPGIVPTDAAAAANGRFEITSLRVTNGGRTLLPPGEALDFTLRLRNPRRLTPQFDLQLRAAAAARPRLGVRIQSSITSGFGVQTVNFMPRVTSFDAPVVSYDWTFADVSPPQHVVTATPVGVNRALGLGDHLVYLTATDVTGRTGLDSINVRIARAPRSGAGAAFPQSGTTPVSIAFAAALSPASAASYEWDLDGNGVADTVTTSGSVSRLITAAGHFRPRVRIVTTVDTTDVRSPALEYTTDSDSVFALALPAPSLNGTLASFTAIVSGAVAPTAYSWDFDDDGVIDTVTAALAASHRYPETGAYTTRLLARDSRGERGFAQVSATSVASVTVLPDSALVIPGTAVRARVVVGASLPVRAVVEILDGDSQRVRELAAGVLAPGQTFLNWDGRDDDGEPLREGIYRAVARLQPHGSDPTDVDASRGFVPSMRNATWTLYAGDRAVVSTVTPDTVHLDRGEVTRLVYAVPDVPGDLVTGYAGYRDNLSAEDLRVASLAEHGVAMTGTRALEWDGAVAPGISLLPLPIVANAYLTTLPPNAITLTDSSGIERADVSTRVLVLPRGALADTRARVSVHFSLARDALVALQVLHAGTGRPVRTLPAQRVAAGADRQLGWDGGTDAGSWAMAGDYRLRLVVTRDAVTNTKLCGVIHVAR